MNKKSKQLAIGLVYGQLHSFLSEYERTDCFNRVPDGAPEEWPLAYTSRRLLEVWQGASALLHGESELLEKMERILAETVYFTRQYERPGVVRRWKQCNSNLIFFDCAFFLLGEVPEHYEQMRMGLSPFHLSCYPDKQWVKRKTAYFNGVKRRFAREGRKFSEEAAFQEELCRTLALVFQNDFGDHCPALQAG